MRKHGRDAGRKSWQTAPDWLQSALHREKDCAMAQPRSTVCLTFDFDAISIWIGPNRSSVSPSAISRGEFGRIGVERILNLLDRKGIKATFFTPGHTAET